MNMLMNKLLLGCVLVISTGCATQTFTLNEQPELVPSVEIMQPFFVSGLGQTQEVDAAEICDGSENVAKVETHMSFLDGVLGTLTSGIYTPRQAKVFCTNKSS